MNSHVEIYLHFVWGTWNREPFISPLFERDLWNQLRGEVLRQNSRLLALGGTQDHVHLLVRFSSTVTIADFVRQIKGNSSLWVNEQICPNFQFKWQGSYGAFSVGRNEVLQITSYIKHQKKHHAENTLMDMYEKMNRPA